MTTDDIIKAVASVSGDYSLATFYRDRERLQFKPSTGMRTLPRHYPDTTPALILAARGFGKVKAAGARRATR